jgi:hypothetical protein
MDPDDNEPIDREAWRRLLATDADAGAPSELTDRRILAEARRARIPRMTRWYLPVSLAASLLLAVALVQWQLEETTGTPPVTESDVLPTQAPVTDDEIAPAVTPAPAAMPQRQDAVAPPPPAVTAPAPDLPVVDSGRTLESAAPAMQATQESERLREAPAAMKSAIDARSPEEWYADIEAMRAAGRTAEADAELARLEAAWPGWLARHHPRND